MDLVDLPLLGRKFTWVHPNGISMSRIDRVLASDGWLAMGDNPALWVLPRTVSDHCPLVVRFSHGDWGPRPFRFNNHWLEHKDFKSLVESYWRNSNYSGWMAYVLKEKLKGLKTVIKEWNRQSYGAVDAKIEKLISEISMLDVKAELVGLSEEEVGRRKAVFSEMWHLKLSKESMVVQRSRTRWLREGDANSSYFHACIKSRRKQNTITALQTADGWSETPEAIRQAVVTYFRNHFSSVCWRRPKLDGVQFPSLSNEVNQQLVCPFQLVEIENAILDSDVPWYSKTPTRLARVMNLLVESTQSAFLKGRNLVDGVVVVNEVVDMARRNGQSCLILKVDFEKAYDSVEWSFLDYMLG
ncbi:transposon TX1 putative 149 kDa protein, partial [Trifolium medium]|nr:transposon TX1 putative 149 kDa protein [Trifolium medium]